MPQTHQTFPHVVSRDCFGRVSTTLLFFFLAAVLPLAFDARIREHNYLSMALNSGPPLAIMLLVWGVTGRAWLGLAAEIVVLAVVHTASALKLSYLQIDLLYADRLLIQSVLSSPKVVLSFVPSAYWAALLGGGALLLCCVIVLWRHGRSAQITRGIVLVTGSMLTVYFATAKAPDVIPRLGWEVFGQSDGALKAGVIGNIVLGKMTARDVDRPTDETVIASFWSEVDSYAGGEPDIEPSELLPDIVLIQSESLFDPGLLNGLPSPYLDTLNSAANGASTQLTVPVYGGRTLQTEFEVLTGVPVSFYTGSMFIYYEIVHRSMNGFPAYLGRLGYRTTAIHPATRAFWRRNAALPHLGFDHFIDEDSFVRPTDYSPRGHVSDLALMRAVLSVLDSATGPSMVSAISIDNHGPWGSHPSAPEFDPQASATLPPHAKGQFSDYLWRARDAERAFDFLTASLEHRDRPTLVLMYGDHLPALPEVFRHLGFRNGLPAEDQPTPLLVWANFDLPPLPDAMPAFLIPGWVVRAARLGGDGHFLAAALVQERIASADGATDALLESYAHVAADGITHDYNSSTVQTVTGSRIGDALRGRVNPSHIADAGDRGLDLRLGSSKRDSNVATVDIAGIDRVILRASYPPDDVACALSQDPSSSLAISLDGALVYDAAMSPDAFRLVVLDTSAATEMELARRAKMTNSACSGFRVLVSQISCSQATCSEPVPGVLLNEHVLGTRILHGDYLEEDARLLPQGEADGDPRNALLLMLSRATARNEAFQPFDIVAGSRLMMHPGQDEPAWIDFDLSGIESIRVSGRIEPLHAECESLTDPGREGGVVGLSFALDGEQIAPVREVSRDNAQVMAIVPNGGSQLRVRVDRGNEVNWCDWFSLGIDELSLER